MNLHRRDFLKISSLTGLSAFLPEQAGFRFSKDTILTDSIRARIYEKLKNPVVIQTVEIVRTQNNLFVRVIAKDGMVGITQCNQRMENLGSLFKGLIVPFFTGKDARDIVGLTDAVYRDERNYKYTGMPFWNCAGHAEIAIWDLLGKAADVPAGQLLGKQLRTEVPVYLSSLTRETTPEQETERLAKELAATGAKAIKIKVGGRMKNTPEADRRSRQLVPLIRKTLGDGITIYADANGSYTVKEGIEIGRLLEDNGVAIFEEPCVWEDYAGNRAVNKALKKIKLAGGEQDTSLYRFRDIVQNNVYDIVQPDVYYNGGLVRALQMAELAQKHGKGIAPHSPKADPLEAAFLQLAAVCPNLYGFQEYPSGAAPQPGWYTPHILIKDGKLPIPTGVGLGVSYDETIWQKAERI